MIRNHMSSMEYQYRHRPQRQATTVRIQRPFLCPNHSNTKWYKDKNGIIHRFQGQNNKFHWNGSTAGENPISPNDIPIEIKRLSEGEL